MEYHLNKNGSKYELVAIAASAGGLEALSRLLALLPVDFPTPIAVVQHMSPGHESLLPRILARKTFLNVKQAEDKEHIQTGIVYLASPDWHLLVSPDRCFSLSQTPPVHFVRPSADVLFSSAAESLGKLLIAVVLTGTGVDGTAGIRKVKQHGGVTIAQDRGTSAHFGMPNSAISTGFIDFILPLEEIPARLVSLVTHGETPDATER